MNNLIFVLEIIGTVAFAVSGAMTAIKKQMDLLGVIILGFTTAVGGGILRDIILGINPPNAFVHSVYAIIAIITSLLVFFAFFVVRNNHENRYFEHILLWMDSIGLGVFTIVGIQTAVSRSPESSTFLLVFLGTLTGVGGGVIRDMMAGDIPYIFVKHFYATSSIIGALVCVILLKFLGGYSGYIAGLVVICALRISAAKFRWKLPHHELRE